MRRRDFFAVLAAGALATGCSRPGRRGPHLEFWTLSLKPTYTAYVDAMRSAYEASHAGLTVEWLDVPERVLMQKLLASLAGGDSPDLVNLGPVEAMRLAQNNALVPLDDLVTAAERARYFPQFWNAIRVNGQGFSIPWYVSIGLLMYNKPLFMQAGLDAAQPPRTWDEIVACARAIRKLGLYGFLPAVRILDDWQMDGLPIVDASGRRAAFATPAHAARIEWYARLLDEDVIPRETLTGDYQEAVRRYKSGTLAMLISGPQFLPRIRDEAPDIYAATGVGKLPQGRANVVPGAVMHFVVPRASRDHAGAARLGLFLTDDANQLALCRMVPLLPSTVAASRDPLFTRGRGEFPIDDRAMRLDAEQLPFARDFTLALPDMGKLNLALSDAVEAAIYGRGPALGLLRQAAVKWDAILARAPRS